MNPQITFHVMQCCLTASVLLVSLIRSAQNAYQNVGSDGINHYRSIHRPSQQYCIIDIFGQQVDSGLCADWNRTGITKSAYDPVDDYDNQLLADSFSINHISQLRNSPAKSDCPRLFEKYERNMKPLEKYARLYQELHMITSKNYDEKLTQLGDLMFWGTGKRKRTVRDHLHSISEYTTDNSYDSLIACVHNSHKRISTRHSSCWQTQIFLLHILEAQSHILPALSELERHSSDPGLIGDTTATKNMLRVLHNAQLQHVQQLCRYKNGFVINESEPNKVGGVIKRVCEQTEVCRPMEFRFSIAKRTLMTACNDTKGKTIIKCKSSKPVGTAHKWFYSTERLFVRQPEKQHVCGVGLIISSLSAAESLISLKLAVCPTFLNSTVTQIDSVAGGIHARKRLRWPIMVNSNEVGIGGGQTHGWIVGAGLYVNPDTNVLSLMVSTSLFPGKFHCSAGGNANLHQNANSNDVVAWGDEVN